MVTQSFTIRVPDDLAEWVDRTAADRDETRTERVLTALRALRCLEEGPA